MWEDLIRGLVLFHLPFFQTQSAWHLENVLAVDPEHPLFLDLVGRLQIQAGDLGSARDTYGRIRSHEDQALKLLGLSRILSHEKSGRNRARKELEKALELKPRAGELFIELGALLLEMDLPHEAASILTRGIDTVSDARRNPRLHSLLARALERVGDASGASAKYLYALTLDPNDRYLAYRRVKLLLASDDYPAAMVILAHLPALTRTYPDIKLSLGLALFNQGYLKQARKELRGFPYSAKAAFCLGKINHKEGKKQEAIKWYQYAQSLDPVEHLDALLVVVEIYREEYRFREALEVINLFLAYAPLSARGRTIQAEILESLFRNDRALFEWITAWKLDKKNPRPILKIAILLRKKGEMKVHEALIKYLDRWPTPLPMILKRALEKERLFHRK